MPVEGHDPAIGRHRHGDSPQLSYRRQAGNYLETAFEELGQFGNGKSARLETRSWILARLLVLIRPTNRLRPLSHDRGLFEAGRSRSLTNEEQRRQSHASRGHIALLRRKAQPECLDLVRMQIKGNRIPPAR